MLCSRAHSKRVLRGNGIAESGVRFSVGPPRKNFMKKKLILPKFKNVDEEMEFWDKLILTDYFEPGDFVRASFPNLKPTPTTPISIRLLNYMIAALKVRANRLSIPYQAIIKQAIDEKLKKS